MLFAVFFEDDVEHADARRRLMPAHLDFLASNPAILAAGPLQDAASGEGAGGLWLVEAEDANAVRPLYEGDPFWPTGLRKSVRVLRLSRVFADGRRISPPA